MQSAGSASLCRMQGEAKAKAKAKAKEKAKGKARAVRVRLGGEGRESGVGNLWV